MTTLEPTPITVPLGESGVRFLPDWAVRGEHAEPDLKACERLLREAEFVTKALRFAGSHPPAEVQAAWEKTKQSRALLLWIGGAYAAAVKRYGGDYEAFCKAMEASQ